MQLLCQVRTVDGTIKAPLVVPSDIVVFRARNPYGEDQLNAA
jgi:hypothetical protein